MSRYYRKWFSDPALPPPGSFDGQTIVVTGGTTGLGLAAAVHYVKLGAAKVVITCRNATRGQNAKQTIEAEAGIRGRVDVVELDMASFDSCKKFVEGLKSTYGNGGQGIDVLVLNAGVFPHVFTKTATGWNESLQVNTLSTVLIVVFVSSGRHLYENIDSWTSISKKEGVIAHLNKEENWPGMEEMYGRSKLLLEYAIEELAKLAKGADGRPQVIMNSLCPGPVVTDLARSIKDSSVVMRVVVVAYQVTISHPAEYGSRIYINTSKAGEDSHGKFIAWYLNQATIERGQKKVLTSGAARKIQADVWKEMVGVLTKEVPEARLALQ